MEDKAENKIDLDCLTMVRMKVCVCQRVPACVCQRVPACLRASICMLACVCAFTKAWVTYGRTDGRADSLIEIRDTYMMGEVPRYVQNSRGKKPVLNVQIFLTK